MRLSERKLYEQEAEIRPNRYVALALTVLSFFIIGMLLVNETGLFRVEKERMRVAVFTALFILEIPLFTAATDAGLRDHRTKYLMLICTEAASAILCITLTFHATLILVLPMLLASQYPSRKVGLVTICLSFAVAFASPLISYLLGTWDIDFLTWLTRTGGYSVSEFAGPDTESGAEALLEIIIYLSMPHAMILLAFSPLSFSISRSGDARMKNQIQVLHMSQSDALTGVFNRTSYEEAITHSVTDADGNVAIIYVDANDLHRLNNEQGHSEGDRLLICVAKALQDTFGNESVYRIGGDEFVCILYGLELKDVQERMRGVCAEVEQQGYSVSYGIEYAQPPCTLPVLITSAETKMLIDKKRYHIER